MKYKNYGRRISAVKKLTSLKQYMKFYEETISEKVMYKGNYLTMVNLELKLPDGNISNKDVVRHPGACGIIPVTEQGDIVLIEQFRKSIEEVIYEIPAGKLEAGEDIKLCALRELEEETGLKAGKLEFLGKISTAPGFCDEFIYLYKATELAQGIKSGDEDEFIETKTFSVGEIHKMIRDGKIHDGKTICAMMYLGL